MLKIRLQGKKKDIRWFCEFLRKHSDIQVEDISNIYSNKGTNRYYRNYVEISRNN